MRRVGVFLAVSLCALVAGQTFGRFGYRKLPSVPGILLDSRGFKADHPSAVRLDFDAAIEPIQTLRVSSYGISMQLKPKPGMPNKMRVSLTSPGFDIYVPDRLNLTVRSLAAVFLSWKEGSVGPKLPTPAVPWIALSFWDEQPPILFAFLNRPVAMQIDGTPGSWTLSTTQRVGGWIRIALPNGTDAFPTPGAAELGNLTTEIQRNSSFWCATPPALTATQIEERPDGVRATWTFDAPGALVPLAVLTAKLGGAAISVSSEMQSLPGALENGPWAYLKGNELSVEFPGSDWAGGRAVVAGIPVLSDPKIFSPFDCQEVVSLAIANLWASRTPDAADRADLSLNDFVLGARYSKEIHTGQNLPYESAGAGLDLVAAHGLESASISTGQLGIAEPNSMLSTALLRLDWRTWRLWADEPLVCRRATTLTSIAAGIAGGPEHRLRSAMLDTGLRAEVGLEIWRVKKGREAVAPEMLNPFPELLSLLWGKGTDLSPLVRALRSPFRFYGDGELSLQSNGLIWSASKNGKAELRGLPAGSHKFAGRAESVNLPAGVAIPTIPKR